MKYVIGNWKMYCNVSQARQLVAEITTGLTSQSAKDLEIVLCPPFTALYVVYQDIQSLTSLKIKLGAQNCYFMPFGAYTGEISPSQLKDFCQYVILGHSERRRYFAEDDKLINKKIKSAIKFGLKPIVCIGEQKRGDNKEGIFKQAESAISGLQPGQIKKIIFAYEPVWAIGTGKQPEPAYANKIIKEIKNVTKAKVVLYGGSVDGENVGGFVKQPDIDGFLVGGASLSAKEFLKIINQVKEG